MFVFVYFTFNLFNLLIMFVIIKENQKRIDDSDISQFHWKNIEDCEINSKKFKRFSREFVEIYNGRSFQLQVFVDLFCNLWNHTK